MKSTLQNPCVATKPQNTRTHPVPPFLSSLSPTMRRESTPSLSTCPHTKRALFCCILVIPNTQMNGDQKIIELLTKISNTLEEIKAQNAMAQPAIARAPAKLPPPPTTPAPAKRTFA